MVPQQTKRIQRKLINEAIKENYRNSVIEHLKQLLFIYLEETNKGQQDESCNGPTRNELAATAK